MAKDPAFLFYPSDFQMGTMGMSYEQKGKYIDLLCLQHSKKGYLKERDIKRILNFNNEDDVEVLEKFKHDENGYFNQRLLEEITKRQKHSEQQRENAFKRWNKNENKVDETMQPHSESKANAKPLENENKDTNINKKEIIPYKEIIDYLNEITGNSYRHTTNDTQKLIKARWNEGFKLIDFQNAIDNAWKHWGEKGKANMKPKTLFNGQFENRVTGDAYNWNESKTTTGNKPKDVEVEWLNDYLEKLD